MATATKAKVQPVALTEDTNGHSAAWVNNYRNAAENAGIPIHDVDTALGLVMFTINGTDHQGRPCGDVWMPNTAYVNGKHHRVIGRYRMAYEYDRDDGPWQENRDKPTIHIDGYGGIERVDPTVTLHYGWDHGHATDKARRTIERTIGAAIDTYMREHPDYEMSAEAAARELAAQEKDRKARYAREEAERKIKEAEKLEAEAAAIRAGGQFQPVK